MSSITADVYAHEFTDSTTTLVDPLNDASPSAPPSETIVNPVERPTNRPPLTIATDNDIEPGEITRQVIQESYPLSPQSSINILQACTNLDPHTLRTIAIGLANTAIGHTFQHLEAKSEVAQLRNLKELTNFALRCCANPTWSARMALRRITAASPTSPSPTQTASCGKPATLSWATARSPLHLAP